MKAPTDEEVVYLAQQTDWDKGAGWKLVPYPYNPNMAVLSVFHSDENWVWPMETQHMLKLAGALIAMTHQRFVHQGFEAPVADKMVQDQYLKLLHETLRSIGRD